MADYAPELKKILKQHGCYFERQGKGDHEIWYSPITNKRFVVDSFYYRETWYRKVSFIFEKREKPGE